MSNMDKRKFLHALNDCYENPEKFLKLVDHEGNVLCCICDIESDYLESKKEALNKFGLERHDFLENGKRIKAYMLYHEKSGFRVIFSDYIEE